MVLILTAGGTITNPTFRLPDTESQLYLDYDARALSAANGTAVAEWVPIFRTADTLESRAALAPLAGAASPALPTYVTDARGGIPALRFGGQSFFINGFRSGGEPSDLTLRKLPGQSLSFTFLARQRDLVPDANGADHRLFGGSTPNQHAMRPGTSGAYRFIAVGSAGQTLSPFIEMPPALGNWFAMTVVYDKPAGEIRTYVNGGAPVINVTTAIPAYWYQLGIGRAMAASAVSAVGFDYARIRMHARALSALDVNEQHALLRTTYNVPDY